MSFNQKIRDGIRSTAYAGIALASLLGSGCTENHYHNYGNIPEKYARKQVQVETKKEVVQRQQPTYEAPKPVIKQEEKPLPQRQERLEEKVQSEEIGLPAGLIPGEDFKANYNKNINAFEISGEFTYRGLKVGEYDKDNRKTYLFFDGTTHNINAPYISVGEKIVIAAPKGKESPSVEFLTDNEMLEVETGDFVVMQSNGSGSIVIERREGRIPKMTSTGDYTMFNGSQVLKFKDEYKTRSKGPLVKPNKNQVNVDITSVGSSPVQVVTLDSLGKRVGTWDVIVDNYNGIKSVSETNAYNDIAVLANGDVTSIYLNFHRLTPEQQRALVKRAPENKIEQIPAPLPENKTQDSKDISWKEGADNNSEVQTKKPVELPEFSNDGVSASFKGENYKRVPGSNKFVSPSGKYFLVD